MKTAWSSVSFFGAVLRFVVAIALVVALVIPHFSTAASASGASQGMDHMSTGDGQMSQMPGHNGKVNGALCVTICAGANQFSGPDMPPNSFSISPAFWTLISDSYWTFYAPDPALRPPDSVFSA